MPTPPTPRLVWPPQPGYFQMRLVSRGWKVPARLVLGDSGWHAIIDEEAYFPHSDPAQARGVAAVWTSGAQIDAATYRWLIALKAWARAAAPDHPCLSPRSPIDPAVLPPIDPSLRRPFAGTQRTPHLERSIEH